jgi:polar amino acid transport system substrate-binding protein
MSIGFKINTISRIRSSPLVALLVFSFAIPVSNGAAANQLLRLCHVPWGVFAGKDLPGKGIYPDITSRVLRKAGYQVEVSIIPWTRCIENVRSREYDIVTAAWEGKSFDADFIYLNNTSIDTINFIVLDGSSLNSGRFEDLRGKKIGILRDQGGMEDFYNHADLFKFIHQSSSELALLRMLIHGRVDAVLTNPAHLQSLANSMTDEMTSKIRALLPPAQINYASPIIAKSHPLAQQIKADFDEAFRALVAEGLYDDLERVHGVRLTHRP